MATEISATTETTQKFISELESQKAILTSATQLFTTLTSHFASLQKTLTEKTQSLDSKFQSLEALSSQTLTSLAQRESSIPERESVAAFRIEELKEAALSEFGSDGGNNSGGNLGDLLRSLCRRMDSSGLLRLVISKRKESVSLRAEISKAVAEEAVDPAGLVLEAVEEFLRDKVGKLGVTDKRWGCGMLVQALFEDGEGGVGGGAGGGPVFSRRVVERAWRVLERWREDGGDGGGGGIVGPAEAVMYLQMVVGFGLRARFEEEFLRELVIEYAARRDMAKVAAAMGFGEKMGDLIDELVKNGKEIEAVYFASESHLTERFPPVSLLKSFLKNSKKSTTTILKNGHYTSAAKDEANTVELNSIKAIIKCVEDHKLESEFPLDSLKKRVSQLEKQKAERRKSSAAAAKPQNKRAHGSSSGRGGAPPASRPAKAAKFSNTIPSFGRRNPAPAQHSPITRYSGPYSYPTQSVYDGHTTNPYVSTYGISHSQSPVAVPQQHYSFPVENVGATSYRAGSSYGGQATYSAYDDGSGAPPSYQLPP